MLITLLLKLAGFLQQVRRFSLVASCFNRDLHVLSSSDQVSNQERYEIPEDSSSAMEQVPNISSQANGRY